MNDEMQPPIAAKIPHSFEIHSQKIDDEYAWLRDPKWPVVTDEKIMSHLNAENQYYKNFFHELEGKKTEIFEELKGRIKLADQSTYIKKDNYFYYTRTEADSEYPIYCRKENSMSGTEEILLDVNELAKGKKYTSVGAFSVSPDHTLVAYSVDFTGNEHYSVRVLDIVSQNHLTDAIENTAGGIVWHEELPGFFYTPTTENWRFDRIMFHKLGSEATTDILVLHEPNPLYNVSIYKSGSKKYIFASVNGHETNEIFVMPMSDHKFTLELMRPKQDKIYYDADHNGKYFYIKTNLDAKNYKIMRADINGFQDSNAWEEYVAEQNDKYLISFDLSKNYLILNYKNLGLPFIKIKDLNDDQEKTIHFPDQAFTASAGQANFEENDIRVYYSSLARPSTTYNYDFNSEKLSILKVQEIPSGLNSDDYKVERIWAENDGVKIPISLFYKKSLFKKDGSNPLYLYGYGSYGISIPPTFRNTAISLVNRGFVFAIAHIRGGDDLGQDWYESAKFLNKKKTFEDFIASAKHLISEKYTRENNIVICGGSAGGLLIGNSINTNPELFKAAIAHVPFVDVVSSMLDESLPLTPGEFKEWGNPKDKEYFDYMMSYDAYNNVKKQNYPNLLVTAGLSDPRVGYWEAAKWVARMRESKTDDNIIIFKTNMEAGHSGASGRFDYLKEAAEDLVFIFKIFGKY